MGISSPAHPAWALTIAGSHPCRFGRIVRPCDARQCPELHCVTRKSAVAFGAKSILAFRKALNGLGANNAVSAGQNATTNKSAHLVGG